MNDEMRPARRVVKIGGSLLDFAPFPERFAQWLGRQPTAPTVLVVGGGAVADAIRAADARFHLGEETSHQLCLEAMGLTARLLQAIVAPHFARLAPPLCHDLRRLRGEPDEYELMVCDVGPWLRDDDSEETLPHTWDVTSDSIAARVAQAIGADELVLLKSCAAPSTSRDAAARIGYVDHFFPVASRGLSRVRAVDLRSHACDETRLI